MKSAKLGLAAIVAATTLSAVGQTSSSTGRVPLPTPAGVTPRVTASQANAAAPQRPVAPGDPIPFPAVDPKNFTAPAPTADTVNSFLRVVWGIDENRDWRVAAIEPSTVPGFVKVDVMVADRRQPTRIANYVFLVTPDGQHAVQGDLAPFGAHPFQEMRTTLQQRADGPGRGAASKDLELVEFADLQCPNCKAAASTMDQIAKDFPQAHIVFQNLPLNSIHPQAMLAAEVGNCVRQEKGDPAFFVYAQKVYDTQADLTAANADATLRAAVAAAGADAAATMTCAAKPETRAAVESSMKLAAELGISSTPTLVVNGRPVVLGQVPYAGLKRLIVYQGQMDGIRVKEQPSLSNLR